MRPRSIPSVLSLLVVAAGCQRSEPARDQPGGAGSAGSAGSAAVTRAHPAPPARSAAPPLPDPLPGQRTDVTPIVGSALRAAIADLDGDGDRELVLVDDQHVRVVAPAGTELARLPVTSGIQQLVTADVDGDGRAEILAGWGLTRAHRTGAARVTLTRLTGRRLVEELVLAPQTSRADIAAIVPMPESRAILIAYFDSKYMVTSVVARRAAQGWQTSPLAQIRMATSYARGDVDGDGTLDLVVARIYGDDQGRDGDAFVLAPDGTHTALPTTRGARSLAITDADGDGRAEIYVGDGWHQNYGAHARGLLTRFRHAAGGFQAELVEDTPGQFGIERIVPATIDGQPVLVTVGNQYVRVFAHRGGRWRGVAIAGPARDLAIGDLDGVPGDELLIVGERSEIVSLRGLAWP